jgi:multicomponent Na+:H+ antiporter subunit G
MHLVAALLLFCGLFFFLAGTVGLIRFPDVFTRMHATTKCDTLGAGLILLGLMFYPGTFYARAKLGLIVAFLWITNTTGAHYMARGIYRSVGRKKTEC